MRTRTQCRFSQQSENKILSSLDKRRVRNHQGPKAAAGASPHAALPPWTHPRFHASSSLRVIAGMVDLASFRMSSGQNRKQGGNLTLLANHRLLSPSPSHQSMFWSVIFMVVTELHVEIHPRLRCQWPHSLDGRGQLRRIHLRSYQQLMLQSAQPPPSTVQS